MELAYKVIKLISQPSSQYPGFPGNTPDTATRGLPMKCPATLLLVLCVCAFATGSGRLNRSLHYSLDPIGTEKGNESEEYVPPLSVLMQPLFDDSTLRRLQTKTAGSLQKFSTQSPQTKSPRAATQNPVANTRDLCAPLHVDVFPHDWAYPSPTLTTGPVSDDSHIREHEIEASQALLMLSWAPQVDGTNFHSSPGQLDPRNGKSIMYSSMAPSVAAKNLISNTSFGNEPTGVDYLAPAPAKTPLQAAQSDLYPFNSRVIREFDTNIMPSAPYIGPQFPTRSILQQSSESSGGTALEGSPKRADWFKSNFMGHYHKQDTMPNDPLPVGFSQRYYYGAVKPRIRNACMTCDAGLMGYKLAYNRFLFLDGYKMRNPVKHPPGKDWAQRDLDKETLKFETFKTLYRLEKDGLVVVLRGRNQLLMASYGIPPLGVILLRSDGGFLLPIARSVDDTVKTCRVQNGDVVVVGSLDLISQLESKAIQLASTDSPKTNINIVTVHSPRSVCIVATVYVRQ